MTEEQARAVAIEEVGRYHDLLVEELRRTPARADGNWNAGDQLDAVRTAGERFNHGQEAAA